MIFFHAPPLSWVLGRTEEKGCDCDRTRLERGEQCAL